MNLLLIKMERIKQYEDEIGSKERKKGIEGVSIFRKVKVEFCVDKIFR